LPDTVHEVRAPDGIGGHNREGPIIIDVWRAPPNSVQNDHTSSVARPSSMPMLKMSVAVVRKMLDAVAGSAP
jgi:hypothetical protein